MEEFAAASDPSINVMAFGLIQLVALSIILERALYVVFDIKWWREKLESGWKSLIAIASAILVCFHLDFDLLPRVIDLSGSATPEGIVLTGLIVSGGSAGAKHLMQDILQLGREHREITKANLANQRRALATE